MSFCQYIAYKYYKYLTGHIAETVGTRLYGSNIRALCSYRDKFVLAGTLMEAQDFSWAGAGELY